MCDDNKKVLKFEDEDEKNCILQRCDEGGSKKDSTWKRCCLCFINFNLCRRSFCLYCKEASKAENNELYLYQPKICNSHVTL